MSDLFLAIILYFQTIAGYGPGYIGTIPADSPLAPPAPPAVQQPADVPLWLDGTGRAL